MADYLILYRKLSEAQQEADIGNGETVPPPPCSMSYYEVLSRNPYLNGRDDVFHKVGIVDGRIGGDAYIFPLKLFCRGDVHQVCAGSNLNVHPWARKSGLGFGFCEFDDNHRDGAHEIFIGAGLSQIAVKVHRFIGYRIFTYPRFVMLLKSRSVLEMKFHGWMLTCASALVDSLIAGYSFVVRAVLGVFSRGVTVCPVDPCNATQVLELERLANAEQRPFHEIHDAQWFKWVLTNSFSKDGPVRAYIVRRKDRNVAFYMTKIRFHEQASHRGFKNVWLGSVIEWGAEKGFEKVLLRVLVRFALSMRKKLDAIEFATPDKVQQGFLKRLGWRHIGEMTACYMVRPNGAFVEPPEMSLCENWRLRPAMGDCALN